MLDELELELDELDELDVFDPLAELAVLDVLEDVLLPALPVLVPAFALVLLPLLSADAGVTGFSLSLALEILRSIASTRSSLSIS
ncbi:hypothetical protein D3C77_368060 [compost metagenome]